MNVQYPQCIDIEQSLLAACLIDKGCIDEAAELVFPDDFYAKPTRLAYKILCDAADNREPIDESMLVSKMIDSGMPDDNARMAISDILLAPAAMSISASAKKIREKAMMRRVIDAGLSLARKCQSANGNFADIVSGIQRQIQEITDTTSSAKKETIQHALEMANDRYETRAKDKNSCIGVPSGLSAIDTITSGFQRSDLVILAARPSMGKTALSTNIAVHAAGSGHRVAFFSLEMSTEQMIDRIISAESGVSSQQLRTGRLYDNDWEKISAASSRLYSLPIVFHDVPGLTVGEFSRIARIEHRNGNLGLIIVDYLQLMSGDGRNGRTEEVSGISRGMKAVARELNIPVIALSQLNRNLEQREDKRPRLSDLRESGSIEQDADLVLMLYRDEVYRPTRTESKGIAEICVAKHRNGPIGTTTVYWDDRRTKFFDLDTKHREYGG